jgi:hypothetical protein
MECDLSTDDLLDEHLGLNDDVTLLFSPDTCDSDGSLGSSEHVPSLCDWEGGGGAVRSCERWFKLDFIGWAPKEIQEGSRGQRMSQLSPLPSLCFRLY